MLSAPKFFRGSWHELYRDHIEPNLPVIEEVKVFHDWLLAYCREPLPVFPVRAVRGAVRRRVYSTFDGTLIAPADNSPAWAVHASLRERRLSCYSDFKALMANMPAHMFDIPKLGIRTANSRGWYIAHIYPAKNGNTEFYSWSRMEAKRRCFLALHPCNIFLVPGVRNRKAGEDHRVIAFIADQYAIRYGSTWEAFLNEIQAQPLCSSPHFGSEPVLSESASAPGECPEKALNCHVSNAPAPEIRMSASYRASRLTFKRDVIEPLALDEQFEVKTPMGVYRFTKRDFYAEFASITRTGSYREDGIYHGKNLHLKAQRFRAPD